ncbi:MAG: AMP-binding protein, partial [Myxococcota bacterium]
MEYNIADLIESVADTVPENIALVCGDRRLTFAQLDARANRLAHAFAAKGIGHGDHVGLHLYNSAEFIEAALALLKVRAVPININYRYVSHELAYLFDNADLVGLVFQRAFAPLIVPALDGLDKLTTFVTVDDSSDADLSAIPGAQEFESFASSGSPERDFGPRSADDLYIVYTGGTTGMPRGVMWRHEDLFFAGLQGGRAGGEDIERPEELAEVVAEGAHLNIHPAAPLIHGAAQLATWIAMLSGGKSALVPGRSFNPKATCELIAREEVNVINL